MKKLLFALIAVFCITSCTKEEDYLYTISMGVESFSTMGDQSGEGYAIFKEFQTALTDFQHKYESNWTWKTTGSSSKSSDVQASNRFMPYSLEFKKIGETYQAKLDACSDTRYFIEYKVSLYLERISEVSSELERETIVLKLN